MYVSFFSLINIYRCTTNNVLNSNPSQSSNVDEPTDEENIIFKQLMSGINNINKDINERHQIYKTMINDTYKNCTNNQLIDMIQKELTTLNNLVFTLTINLSNENKLAQSENVSENYTGRGLLNKTEISQLEQQLKEDMKKLTNRTNEFFEKILKEKEISTSKKNKVILNSNPENVTVVELTGKESDEFKRKMGGGDFTNANSENTRNNRQKVKLE